MAQEVCENCGRSIGKLETAHIFDGHIVCEECKGRMQVSGKSNKNNAPHPIESTPTKAEDMLFRANPAMFRNKPILFILCLLLIPLGFGLGLLILIIWFLGCKASSLTVTSKRTVFRHGLLSKQTNEVRHQDIRNIQVSQSFLQRIFNVGTVSLSSAGQSEMEIIAAGIPGPQKVADLIRQCQG